MWPLPESILIDIDSSLNVLIEDFKGSNFHLKQIDWNILLEISRIIFDNRIISMRNYKYFYVTYISKMKEIRDTARLCDEILISDWRLFPNERYN